MIRIFKGEGKDKKVLKVPIDAFENFFSLAGWQKENDTAKESNSEEDEWAGYDDGEEFTKPLSEMTRSELEAYAVKLGVDLSGLTSNKQYREAIKAAM